VDGVGSGVVAVDVGVGVGVVTGGVGVGVGVAEAEADFDGDGDGLAVVAWAVGVGRNAGPWLAAVDWLTVGDALAGVPALPVGAAGALLVTGVLEPRTASSACGTCEPVSARAVMIPADVTATTMPAAAAIRASIRALRRGDPIGCGNPFGPKGPARRVTSCRYVSAGGLVSEHSPSTSSRSQPGRTASGAMPNSAAFRSVPRLRLPQTSH
jgi:hypothetical protein